MLCIAAGAMPEAPRPSRPASGAASGGEAIPQIFSVPVRPAIEMVPDVHELGLRNPEPDPRGVGHQELRAELLVQLLEARRDIGRVAHGRVLEPPRRPTLPDITGPVQIPMPILNPSP